MASTEASRHFHNASKIHRLIPNDPKDWPEEWNTIFFKEYKRVPKISLPSETTSFDLFGAIEKRKSSREFNRESLTMRELAILLKYSCGQTIPLGNGVWRRAQPSGGARFPIEIYPIIFRSYHDNITAGAYHYNVKEHCLELLEKFKACLCTHM